MGAVTRARKIIAVEDIKERANAMLRNSRDDVKEGRMGIAVFLEGILVETGNYHGFRHIDGKSGYADDTRRQYY
jgi:hypothetical protein